MKYTLADIAQITGGTLHGNNAEIKSILTDSRRSFASADKPLFVAISGTLHDGHDFIETLYMRGVRAFLVEKLPDTERFSEAGFVLVLRSIGALQALAENWRKRFKGKVIGITGSRGKTAVKELIANALSPAMRVFRSPRSYNSQLGVPLSVLMIQGDEDIAVIEAGISRPNEMAALARIIRPDIGVFTGLGVEHSENFESDEERFAEKMLLFEGAERVFGSRTPTAPDVLASQICDYLGVRATIEPQSVLDYNISDGVYNSIVVSDPENYDLNSLSIALDYLRSVAGERKRMLIMTDVLYNSLSDSELYRRMAEIVRTADISLLVGVGERISVNATCFVGIPAKFFATAREAVGGLYHNDLEGKAILLRGDIQSEPRRLLNFLSERTHTTTLRVNLDAIAHNISVLRSMTQGTLTMAMVKASSYGNGGYEIASLMADRGVDYLAVAFADEGAALREQGITMPIVVLNGDEDNFELMIAHRLEPEIYNFRSLTEFARLVKESGESGYPIHLKIDSGMHRWGFEETDVERLNKLLKEHRNDIVVRSLFSHLAAADDPTEDNFTRGQIALFQRIADKVESSLTYRPLHHIAGTAAAIRFPEARMDMCRFGIGLYGIGDDRLRAVSTLATRIMQIRTLHAGDRIGYGREGVIDATRKIATLPIGYADGLDRRLGNERWSVLVEGKPCPTVGRISMDSCSVDITETNAVEGDEAIVFSPTKGNSVADLARTLDTIPYEIMTSVSERVKRIFVKE